MRDYGGDQISGRLRNYYTNGFKEGNHSQIVNALKDVLYISQKNGMT